MSGWCQGLSGLSVCEDACTLARAVGAVGLSGCLVEFRVLSGGVELSGLCRGEQPYCVVSGLHQGLTQTTANRAPPNRKQKQRAAGAKLWSNHFKTGGYPCILAAQATAQSPPYPIWTDPTNPARRPSDRPIAAIDTPRAPTLGPLGTRPDKTQGMGPPGPPAFSCFRFSRPPSA